MFVIIAFNEALIESAVDWLGDLPVFGAKLQAPFKDFLSNQKAKLHARSDSAAAQVCLFLNVTLSQLIFKEVNMLLTLQGPTWLAWLFEKLIVLMILYFLVSIINSLAQKYHKRKCQERRAVSVTSTAAKTKKTKD